MKTTIITLWVALCLSCLASFSFAQTSSGTNAPATTTSSPSASTPTSANATTDTRPESVNNGKPAVAYIPDATNNDNKAAQPQQEIKKEKFLWFFDNHFKLLALLMILAGILGGVASYFIYIGDKPVATSGILRQILISLAASFLIPLFLQMVSSTILANSRTEPLQYFVLFSFCLIGALFSTRFIQTVGERVLQDMERKYDELYRSVETIMTNETEPVETKPEVYNVKGRGLDNNPAAAARTDISDNELNVLRAIRKSSYTFRNIMGISADAALDLPEVKEHLSSLQKKGLVERKPGGTEWYITAAGKKVG